MGGYEHTFVDEIAAKYHCNICSKVLRDARLTVCCGQHYCDSCLKQWLASKVQNLKKTCPHCRQEKFQSFQNKAIIREINEFRVKCTHHLKGCDWEGELSNLEKHVNSNDGCGFTLVKCNGFGFVAIANFPSHKRIECDEQRERRLLTEHQKTCKFRRCKCPYCGHIDTYDAMAGSGKIRIALRGGKALPAGSNHFGVCGQYPLECPNNCGEKAIKRDDMPRHRELCPLEPLPCPFKNVGCSAKVLQRDMDSHCQTNMQTHLLMMVKSHDGLLRKNEELIKQNKELVQNNEKLDQQNKGIVRRLAALEADRYRAQPYHR